MSSPKIITNSSDNNINDIDIPDRYVNHKNNKIINILSDESIDSNNSEELIQEMDTIEIDSNQLQFIDQVNDTNHSNKSEIRHIEKNQDRNQMIQVYILFIIEIFKVAMASFLSMSVIQNCGGEVCGYSDNLNRQTLFGKFVVGVNSFNIISFAILYFYEFSREMFLIQYLDIDKQVGDFHLPVVLENYSYISNKLKRYNSTYYICTRILLFLTSINWILSGILVFKSFYSFKTITSFATNILLVITKLSDSYRISKESYKYNYGLSAYMKEFTSFNVIDKDYK